MHYVIRTGVLFSQEDRPLAQLKGAFSGQEKTVCTPDGTVVMRTMIRRAEQPVQHPVDVHSREYVLLHADGTQIAQARPDYAQGADLSAAGWPVCKMPEVDHASVHMHGEQYRLNFQNSQNYTLTDRSGGVMVQILHRGLAGGWNVDAGEDFSPEEICGLFVFCRYLEQENEMMVL